MRRDSKQTVGNNEKSGEPAVMLIWEERERNYGGGSEERRRKRGFVVCNHPLCITW